MTALVLHNARVLTMNPTQPRAEALLVRAGHIAATGRDSEVRAAAGSRYDVVDCRGAVVAPAFIDAHIHLLSYAASLSAVDCSPAAVRDIPALLQAITTRAARTTPDRWIRATGYRETELAERRHPTRWELDAAAPRNPVRLIHGSGHGSVLSSAALVAVGITNETEEPSGAFIGRRLEDGAIDGLLLELNDLLDARIPHVPWDDIWVGVGEACSRLLRAGVTAVHDMGVRNDTETFNTFAQLQQEGALTVDVASALGIAAFLAGERPPGWSRMVKAVISELDGRPEPDAGELAALVERVESAGARLCIHAVSERACETACETFALASPPRGAGSPHHRIEHAAVCSPATARRLAGLGVIVVANPGFMFADGDRYLRQIDPGSIPFLHNPGALAQAGVAVACGSDAPVSEPRPLRSIVASVTRLSGGGRRLPGAVMSVEAALAAHTRSAAIAGGKEKERGSIEPGLWADLVLLAPEFLREPQYTAEPVGVMQAGRWVVDTH